jgi:hypothetical protein
MSEIRAESPNGLDSTLHSITPTFNHINLQEDVIAFGSIKKPPKSRFSSLGRVWTTLTSRRSRESRRVLSDNLPSLPRGRAARINHLAVVADSTQSTVSGQNDDEEVDQEVELARSESSEEEGQGDHAPRSPERVPSNDSIDEMVRGDRPLADDESGDRPLADDESGDQPLVDDESGEVEDDERRDRPPRSPRRVASIDSISSMDGILLENLK